MIRDDLVTTVAPSVDHWTEAERAELRMWARVMGRALAAIENRPPWWRRLLNSFQVAW